MLTISCGCPFYMGSWILTSPRQPLEAVCSSRGHLTRVWLWHTYPGTPHTPQWKTRSKVSPRARAHGQGLLSGLLRARQLECQETSPGTVQMLETAWPWEMHTSGFCFAVNPGLIHAPPLGLSGLTCPHSSLCCPLLWRGLL